jgi:hypothetical protein
MSGKPETSPSCILALFGSGGVLKRQELMELQRLPLGTDFRLDET